MIGAIIGDIVGSRFEFGNIKTKDFELFTSECAFTDDTVMSLAVAGAITESGGDIEKLPEIAVRHMKWLGRKYPYAGYGGRFTRWLTSDDLYPYNSFGNGSAMRVSPCGFAARSLEEAKHLSYNVTYVTHNHYEGIKGAEAAAVAVFLAKSGYGRDDIKKHICENYYNIDFTLDEIRPSYRFDVSCRGTLPYALEAFFESDGFEDAVRNAISIGGDSDTIAAITGAVAEAFYGVPDDLRAGAESFLTPELKEILYGFETIYQK